MRTIAIMLFVLIITSPLLAVSDVGLIEADKSLGYYLMPNSTMSHYSSGLVFNQKNAVQSEIEILYTSFQSVYLLTTNLTQINAHKKYKLAQLGPLGLTGVLGLGFMYSPAFGGGVVGDVGGIITLNVLKDLAFSFPLYGSLFTDGMMMNFFANLNFKPAFLRGLELFGGYKLDARMVGFGSTPGAQGGTMYSYCTLGLRRAL